MHVGVVALTGFVRLRKRGADVVQYSDLEAGETRKRAIASYIELYYYIHRHDTMYSRDVLTTEYTRRVARRPAEGRRYSAECEC